ncbi:hypothetical protein R6Q59_009820 [Mikania micrantha]
MSFEDDKSQYVVPFIQKQLGIHQKKHPNTPFFIGLNGVQGAGKSVLVDILHTTLQSPPHNLNTVVFSLDDMYLTHADQVALAESNPNNPLLQHRGQPSTHDIELANKIFQGLKQGKPTKIPRYNKAAYSGQGDREDESTWEAVNTDPDKPIRVVLFEGWCVGFRPLSDQDLQHKYENAVAATKNPATPYKGRLGYNTLESVTTVNDALKRYDEITDQLDAFILIDAADTYYVYKWRLQQEEGLWAKKGSGMTSEQVINFVNGYYPAYELYTDTLREEVFKRSGNESTEKGQLRLIVGEDRKVKTVVEI